MSEDDNVPEGMTEYVVREYYGDETGLQRTRIVTLNGKWHSPPDGSPAHEVYDEQGRPTTFRWLYHGKSHRIGAPSSIFYNYKTGIVGEQYSEWGEPIPPSRGPHVVRKSIETGEIISTDYAPSSNDPKLER